MTDELALTSFRDHFGQKLKEADFNVLTAPLIKDSDPILLAENPYYIIAFQAFDSWSKLIENYEPIESALSELIGRHPETPKVWDAYLVLVCRAILYNEDEFDEFSNLIYNTRYTRKIVRVGVSDLTTIEELAKPFVHLERARLLARKRDSLQILAEKMISSGLDKVLVNKLVTVFREGGDLSIV
jgi:hypothetical protein